jgi:DUF1009 family protein
MANAPAKLGVIAGAGHLPRLLINAAKPRFDDCFVLAFEGDTLPETIQDVPHQWLAIDEIARTLELFQQENVTHVVMAGKISRPPLKALKPPVLAAKIIARLGKALFAGDDALFSAITHIFEESGFKVIGADDILADLLTPEGILTMTSPDRIALEDIAGGISMLHEIGKLDIGQGLIIKRGQVLGVEALEGTDAMIARCATLGDAQEKGGVLLKARKAKQERRVDLPAIGPDTITHMAAAGFSGIAIEAGGSLIIDRAETLKRAEQHRLFIMGFRYDD